MTPEIISVGHGYVIRKWRDPWQWVSAGVLILTLWGLIWLLARGL